MIYNTTFIEFSPQNSREIISYKNLEDAVKHNLTLEEVPQVSQIGNYSLVDLVESFEITYNM